MGTRALLIVSSEGNVKKVNRSQKIASVADYPRRSDVLGLYQSFMVGLAATVGNGTHCCGLRSWQRKLGCGTSVLWMLSSCFKALAERTWDLPTRRKIEELAECDIQTRSSDGSYIGPESDLSH